MIQRIQTVWLLLASALVFLTIKMPFYSGTDSTDFLYRTLTGTSNMVVLVLSSALGTFIFVSIFMFKQRRVQMRMVWIAIIVECLILYLYYRQTTFFAEGNVSFWAVLHPLILLFLFFASRGIYRDAKLIKASNRLR